MNKLDKKKQERPITAQPVGDPFLVKPGRSRTSDGSAVDSRGRHASESLGFGCYRRVPRFSE